MKRRHWIILFIILLLSQIPHIVVVHRMRYLHTHCVENVSCYHGVPPMRWRLFCPHASVKPL